MTRHPDLAAFLAPRDGGVFEHLAKGKIALYRLDVLRVTSQQLLHHSRALFVTRTAVLYHTRVTPSARRLTSTTLSPTPTPPGKSNPRQNHEQEEQGQGAGLSRVVCKLPAYQRLQKSRILLFLSLHELEERVCWQKRDLQPRRVRHTRNQTHPGLCWSGYHVFSPHPLI